MNSISPPSTKMNSDISSEKIVCLNELDFYSSFSFYQTCIKHFEYHHVYPQIQLSFAVKLHLTWTLRKPTTELTCVLVLDYLQHLHEATSGKHLQLSFDLQHLHVSNSTPSTQLCEYFLHIQSVIAFQSYSKNYSSENFGYIQSYINSIPSYLQLLLYEFTDQFQGNYFTLAFDKVVVKLLEYFNYSKDEASSSSITNSDDSYSNLILPPTIVAHDIPTSDSVSPVNEVLFLPTPQSSTISYIDTNDHVVSSCIDNSIECVDSFLNQSTSNDFILPSYDCIQYILCHIPSSFVSTLLYIYVEINDFKSFFFSFCSYNFFLFISIYAIMNIITCSIRTPCIMLYSDVSDSAIHVIHSSSFSLSYE